MAETPELIDAVERLTRNAERWERCAVELEARLNAAGAAHREEKHALEARLADAERELVEMRERVRVAAGIPEQTEDHWSDW